MLNEGFGIQMAYEYYNWNEVIHSYKVTRLDMILPRAPAVGPSNDTAVWNISWNLDLDCIKKPHLKFEKSQHKGK